MNALRPFRSFHSIGGVVCDFPSKKELLGYLEQAISPPAQFVHIVTLNAEMVVEAQNNKQFKNAIANAELVIPDGSSILWARDYLSAGKTLGVNDETPRVEEVRKIIYSLIKFLFSKDQPITGVDTIFDICQMLEKKNGSVYLLGGKQNEADKTAEILRKKYPGITAVCLPPQRLVFSPLTPSVFPAVILVALGAPKQTLWIEGNREALVESGVTIAMGVGGAFAMISNTLPRAPQWMRAHHLEWLWRLILEPYRIKRIWNAVVIFPLVIYRR